MKGLNVLSLHFQECNILSLSTVNMLQVLDKLYTHAHPPKHIHTNISLFVFSRFLKHLNLCYCLSYFPFYRMCQVSMRVITYISHESKILWCWLYVSDLSHLIFMLQMTRLKISRVNVSNYCYITDTHTYTRMHIVLYLSLCLLITNHACCLILLVNQGSRLI